MLYEKCLEKLAERSKKGRAAEIAAGGALAYHAAPKVLGYHRVYHGNSNAAAVTNIKKQGLRKNYSGTGVSMADSALNAGGSSSHHIHAQGKVFLTKNKPYALTYTKDIFSGTDARKIVSGKISHKQYSNAKKDPLVQTLSGGAISKRNAFTVERSIPATKIKGSKHYRGARQYARLKNLKEYVGVKGGKRRLANGIGMGLAGAALAAHALSPS
jgi:hypothetical protein